MEFTELTTEEEWLDARPVLEGFWPEMDEATFLDYRERLRDRDYRLFALREAEGTGDPAAVAGLYSDLDVWYGQHVRVRDLVVSPDRRSEGLGERLLERVENWGRKRGHESLVLCSALDREKAHEFYEDHGMERDGYRFTKSL